MPAVITVKSDAAQQQSFWIEDDVLRLGSGTACEVSLAIPDLPAHFATLEFVDGRYFIHNRCEYDLLIGGANLSPQRSCQWSSGTFLHVGGVCSLVLQIDGDPRPCKKPFFAREPEVLWDEDQLPGESAEPEATSEPRSSLSRGKLFVILVCVLVIPLLLLDDPAAPSGAKQPHVAFEEMVSQCDNAVIKAGLQDAWLLQLRGKPADADRLYRRILEVLDHQSIHTEDDSRSASIREYVRDRRAEL